MPKITISENIGMNLPVEKIYDYIHDFGNWKEWSPWLVCEDDCVVNYKDDSKKGYSWEGKYVGIGEMSLNETVENESFEYALEFFKPWKSKADVQFNLAKQGDGTEVIWSMQSSLPWFLWWMKPMMTRMISMDYQRGLKMMKKMLEDGVVDSKLEYTMDESFPARAYLGVANVCKMDDIETHMDADFKKLTAAVADKEIEATEFFTIYHKWKLGKGEVGYTVCAGVDVEIAEMAEMPAGFVSGEREACDGFVITHTGEYHHLGNAWAAGMLRARSRPPVFRQSKKQMPFEIYMTLPGSDEDVVTKVVFPKA